MQRLDHVMVLVDHLEDASARYESEHGLIAIPGGSHDELGTSNAIVPLGEDYIELIAVTDRDVAAGNPVGQFLLGRLRDGGRGPVAVCLRTSDPTGVAARTGSQPFPMQRLRPDGGELHWEVLGMEGALLHGLPFFVSWTLDEDHPARTPVGHPSRANGIAWVEIGGVASEVRAWIGADEAHLRLVGGEPGVHGFAVSVSGGELVLS